MIQIECLTAEQYYGSVTELIELLVDAVHSGASLGFLPPLSIEEARQYWLGVLKEIAQRNKLLFVAVQGDRIIGAIQLALESKANAKHRAEVQKLCVHTQFRGEGIGKALLSALEERARMECRSLLVLDTRVGDVAEQLYKKQGYTAAGIIPSYTRGKKGEPHDTVFFYKSL